MAEETAETYFKWLAGAISLRFSIRSANSASLPSKLCRYCFSSGSITALPERTGEKRKPRRTRTLCLPARLRYSRCAANEQLP